MLTNSRMMDLITINEATKWPVKKDSTLDLLTIMSDRVTVKFKIGEDKYETDTGRWCNPCK